MDFNEKAKEYFKSQNVVVTLYPENNTRSFEELGEFYDFIKTECDYWKVYDRGQTTQIRDHFNVIINFLNSINNYSYDESQMNNNIRSAINSVKVNRFPCIFSTTSFGKKINLLYGKSSYQLEAFFDYNINHQMQNSSNIYNIEYLKGLFSCFTINDSEEAMTLENNAQREALFNLHEEYINKIDETHDEFKEKTIETDNIIKDFTEKTYKLQNEFDDSGKKLLEENKNTFNSLTQKMNELENLYKEKLSLAAPAEYWKKLSDNYMDRGKLWVIISIISSVILCILLTVILYNLPNSLTELNNKITYDNIRGTIIFALIVSVAIYVIRLFIKLALSSYHLARDAKEREQLTYVYLALMKDKAIEPTERNIVLQAIFSRADTGLLKGDSSPTLPDGVVSQILKNIGK